MPSFRDHLLTDEKLDEVLAKADPTSKWIRDFVKSDNPKFEGKSKKERIKMALGAYYAKQRNEEVESVDEGARERLSRMMQDKAMVKNPPKIPTPAERRAKEQEEKNAKKDIEEARDPSKMSTKAIRSEIEQIEKKDFDTTSPEESARHTALSREHSRRTTSVPSGMASGYEVDKAVKRGLARKAKAAASTQTEDVDALEEQIHHWSVHHGDGTVRNYPDEKTAKAEYERVKKGRYGKNAKLKPVTQKEMKKLKSYVSNVFKQYGAGGDGMDESIESIDEISQETKAAYTTKAKAQVKELKPFAKKKSEYRDLAKNLIAKRTAGIAKANEEVVEETIDEAVVHDQYDQYNAMAAKKANDIINSLGKHKKAVYQGYPNSEGYMKEKGSRMHSEHVMSMKNLCRTLQDIHDGLQMDVENNTPMTPQKVGK